MLSAQKVHCNAPKPPPISILPMSSLVAVFDVSLQPEEREPVDRVSIVVRAGIILEAKKDCGVKGQSIEHTLEHREALLFSLP